MEENQPATGGIILASSGSSDGDNAGLENLEVIEVLIVGGSEECTAAVMQEYSATIIVEKQNENEEEMEQDLPVEEAANQHSKQLGTEDQEMQDLVNASENIGQQIIEETLPVAYQQQIISSDINPSSTECNENSGTDAIGVGSQEESVIAVVNILDVNKNADGWYKCRFCEFSFEDENDWKNHEEKEHRSKQQESGQPIEVVWGCESCAVVFASEELLVEHLKTHNVDIATEPPPSDKDASAPSLILEIGGKKYFRCKFCFKCFGSKEEKWRRHELLHLSEKSLKCYICAEVFCRKHQYEAHMKRHLTNKKSIDLECKFCKKYFPSESSFEEHVKAHVGELLAGQKKRKAKKRSKSKSKSKKKTSKKDHKCRFCQKSFKDRQDRCEKHELTHFTYFKCYFCEELFSSRVRCNLHEMEHETKCRHCGEMFSTVHDLRIHEATHSKVKLIQCRYCDKLFYKTSNRRRHEMTHTGEKPHKCSHCGKAFRLIHHKKKHERLHVSEPENCGIPTVLPPPTPLEPPTEKVVEPKYFRCRFCLKCFGSKEEKWRRHELLHLSDTSLKCQYCDEVFCRKHQFQAHVQRHIDANETIRDESVFECQLCNTFYVTADALQEHLNNHASELIVQQKKRKEGKKSKKRSQDDEKKEFSCRICLKPFGRRQDRCESHELKHVCKPAFKCFFCEKMFNSKVKRNVHEMEHEAKCRYCEEIFPSVSKLRIHEALHQKKWIYRCGYCEKMFQKTSNRKRHELTHTGERPYKCSYCDKAFRLVHHLKKHERGMHKKQNADT